MNIFWLTMAGLIAVVAAAILFGLFPILRKKTAEGSIGTGGVVPAFTGRPATLAIGSISALLFAASLFLAWDRQGETAQHASGQAQSTMETEMHFREIAELKARLKLKPDDGYGWAALARAYVASARYPEAAEAYGKAEKLVKDDAEMLVDYADVLALVNGKSMQGRPLELIRQALKADPNNAKGLALLGTAEFQAGNYGLAEKHWGRLLSMLQPDSQFAKQISAGISDAHARASGETVLPALEDRQPSGSGGRISGIVKLSPALSGRVAPTDTVFVFAKPVSGSSIPIAVMRASAGDLPIRFSLDDSMAMVPSIKLSAHKSVTIGAKISRSGSASQQSGDLKGEVPSVTVGSGDVRLLIDQVAP